MSPIRITEDQASIVEAYFGERLERDAPLSRYTLLRVGGAADYLVKVKDSRQLEDAVRFLWDNNIPWMVIGAGSNMLISPKGIAKVVLINQAKDVEFREENGPVIRAESGAFLSTLARRAASRGWAGLEWAAGIPGTLGGAVIGNAGAHGGDTAEQLLVADILHREGQQVRRSAWSAEDLDYEYRSSALKKAPGTAVVLSASLRVEKSTPEAVKARMKEFAEYRKKTQPPGPSLGSMFKNPAGDYAGRLIEEAGLKGEGIGGARISEKHANFFLNEGGATAEDFYRLIQKARREVKKKFDVDLELEIVLVGDWEEDGLHGG